MRYDQDLGLGSASLQLGLKLHLCVPYQCGGPHGYLLLLRPVNSYRSANRKMLLCLKCKLLTLCSCGMMDLLAHAVMGICGIDSLQFM